MALPGGFDRFVLELAGPLEEPAGPPDMAKVMETAARFGTEIHGASAGGAGRLAARHHFTFSVSALFMRVPRERDQFAFPRPDS